MNKGTKRKLVILGSTGSIGQSALELVRLHPDRFEVLGLVAHSNSAILQEQVREFLPRFAVLTNPQATPVVATGPTEWLPAETGAIDLAQHQDADVILSAIVGAAGLKPTFAALRAGKTVALANKESLVAAGPVMLEALKQGKGTLLPVDSEHSAIHQALRGYPPSEVDKIILTASGGPFRTYSLEQLQKVTVQDALKHPNWSMGSKITIDSASLMNKGLEMIEAKWLFDVPASKIDVVVHPQSIIHSIVQYVDGSQLAQMGWPNMKTPIAYALAYPDRMATGMPMLDLIQANTLTFEAPKEEHFACLHLAKEVLKSNDTSAAVMNAANEVAVQAFLQEKLTFLQIPQVIEDALLQHHARVPKTLEDVLWADAWSRRTAQEIVQRRKT